MKMTPQLKEQFRLGVYRQLQGVARASYIVGFISTLAFVVVDYSLVPHLTWEFFTWRAGISVIILLAILFHHKLNIRYVNYMTTFLAGLVCTMLIFMIAKMGELGHWYVYSLVVTIFGTAVFTWDKYLASSLAVYLSLLYAGLMIYSGELSTPVVVTNVGFLLLTGFCSGTISHYLMSLKLKEFISQAKLKEMDRLKTNFFSNVSHEFRTPITLLLGPIEELRHNPSLAEDPKLIESMHTNALRLLSQVNNILDLSKLEDGSMKPSLVAGDIAELIERLMSAARPFAKKNGIELITELENTPVLNFDRKHMETVFTNLISNAIKFTEKGGRIRIRSHAGRDSVRFEVEDTGSGIPEDHLEKVFERFQQVDGSHSRKAEGTGLGLALVKELIQLHDGDIRAESKLGEGTKFIIELPVSLVAQEKPVSQLGTEVLQATGTEDTKTTAVQPQYSSLHMVTDNSDEENNDYNEDLTAEKSATILYADDNPHLRSFVKRLLADEYAVLLAKDGEDAWELIQKHKPDIILSDLMMPKVTGIELLSTCKSHDSFKDTPFVMLTAKTEQDSKISGLELGVDEYLYKPFHKKELRIRIGNLLKLRKAQNRIKEELLAAREIQHSLLPDVETSFKNITVDRLYKPCEELSGDFYDIIETKDWLYIYLADVTSHGTASAQITYLLREMFRKLIQVDSPIGLDKVMQGAAYGYSQYGLNHWVGLQLMRVNFEAFEVEYIGRNCPSALLVSSKKDLLTLDPDPGQGLTNQFKNEEYKVKKTQLQSGQALFAYTDGAYEFPVDLYQKQYGERRLHRLLKKQGPGADLNEVYRLLLQECSFEEFDDDMTILSIKGAA